MSAHISQKRISYIDMAKGIGILLVVIGHSEFPTNNLITWISSFHMPLFFIISGVLFKYKETANKKFGEFIAGRARTILIPYAVFSVVSIIASSVLDYDSIKEGILTTLMQTLSGNGIAVLWFLPVLFLGESVFLLIKKHTANKGTVLAVLAIAALSIGGNELFGRYYTVNGGYLNLFGGYMTAVVIRTGIAVTFLAAGYYTYGFLENGRFYKWIYPVFCVIFLALNVLTCFYNGGTDLNQLVFHNYALYYIAAVSGSMAVLCLCRVLPDIPPLAYVGTNSLIIMVTHVNCRFLGVSYMAGRIAASKLLVLGQAGYVITVVLTMFILEAAAIYVINRFMPFIIGRKKSVV